MIDGIELTNFRAFRHEVFDFRKINIFAGPNNSGKSSALSAINVLAQTVDSRGVNSGPLLLNGPYDQLGTFKDTVHGGRANTPIKFRFSSQDYNCEFELKYRTQRREIEISRFKLTKLGRPIFEYSTTKDRYDIYLEGKSLDSLGMTTRKRRPIFFGFLPQIRSYSISREIENLDIPRKEEIVSILRGVDRELDRFRNILFRMFFNYETISPFRVQPQRTYLYSGESADRVGRNGQETITILAADASRRGSEKIGYVEAVSRWLQLTGIAGGISVKHLTDRHFEICVIGKDGTEHNVCDVGFGVSQVLPVLTAGVSFANTRGGISNPLLVIQEPEIHLHPNAQAELGTFFASISRSKGQIFLETHSDNLVLRIARHVAAGDLSPEDVMIYFVEDHVEGRKVSKMQIDRTGSFTPEWPGGFFPQRQSESFELARAAFAVSRGEESPQLELFNFTNR